MATKRADVRIDVTVEFEDDGQNGLNDQAIAAAEEALGIFSLSGSDAVAGYEVIGMVRDAKAEAA